MNDKDKILKLRKEIKELKKHFNERETNFRNYILRDADKKRDNPEEYYLIYPKEFIKDVLDSLRELKEPYIRL